MEEGIAAVFLDLCKTFNSVPHKPLLDKLKSIGLSEYLNCQMDLHYLNREQHEWRGIHLITHHFRDIPRICVAWVLYSCSTSMI